MLMKRTNIILAIGLLSVLAWVAYYALQPASESAQPDRTDTATVPAPDLQTASDLAANATTTLSLAQIEALPKEERSRVLRKLGYVPDEEFKSAAPPADPQMHAKPKIAPPPNPIVHRPPLHNPGGVDGDRPTRPIPGLQEASTNQQ